MVEKNYHISGQVTLKDGRVLNIDENVKAHTPKQARFKTSFKQGISPPLVMKATGFQDLNVEEDS